MKPVRGRNGRKEKATVAISDLLKSEAAQAVALALHEKARAYIRVSHERSAEKNISPETQRQLIMDYAERHGYEIVEWYTDLAKSAFRDDDLRVEYHRMLAAAKADPETKVVLVAYYDRFSRGRNAQSTQYDLLDYGVRIESATEGYVDPTTESGVVLSGVNWAFNHLTSLKISHRIVPCMKTNFAVRDADTGWAYKNGGWAMFGYRNRGVHLGKNSRRGDIYKVIWVKDDRMVGGKQVWEWARTMLIDWRLKERLGYDSIAERLTRAGVPTPSGRDKWSNSSIQSLLADWDRLYQYTGIGFWNREDCTDRKNRKRRPSSEWVVVEEAHAAIITNAECDAIFAMVKDNKRTRISSKGRPSRWVLSGGFVKCKHCGSNFASKAKNGKDYYICGSHLYRRGAGCGAGWQIPREELEDLVIDRISSRIAISDEALVFWGDEFNRASEEDWREFAEARKKKSEKLTALKERLGSYYDIAASTGLTDELSQKIGQTAAAIDQLNAQDAVKKPEPIDVEEVKLIRNQLAEIFATGDKDAKRLILKQFVVEITADAEKREIVGRFVDPRLYGASFLAAPRGVVGNVYIRPRTTRLTWLGRHFRVA